MPVATIIQAVSAPSILVGAAACAKAGEAASHGVPANAIKPNRARMTLPLLPMMDVLRSERVAVGFAGADAQRVLDRPDENLAVADLPGARRRAERLDHPVGVLGCDRDLDADLGQEVHDVLGAAIDFGVALLAAVAFDFRHRHAADADAVERLAHLVD